MARRRARRCLDLARGVPALRDPAQLPLRLRRRSDRGPARRARAGRQRAVDRARSARAGHRDRSAEPDDRRPPRRAGRSAVVGQLGAPRAAAHRAQRARQVPARLRRGDRRVRRRRGRSAAAPRALQPRVDPHRARALGHRSPSSSPPTSRGSPPPIRSCRARPVRAAGSTGSRSRTTRAGSRAGAPASDGSTSSPPMRAAATCPARTSRTATSRARGSRRSPSRSPGSTAPS